MALFRVLLLAALAAQQGGLCAEANGWGQAVDGMQMSVALVSETGHDPLIRIMVRSVGDKPQLLPLGKIIGGEVYTWNVRVFVSTPEGQFKFLLSPFVFVGGRVDPIAIPLVPKSSYTFEMQVTDFFRGDGTAGEVELPKLVREAGQLWAEWEGGPPQQPSSATTGSPTAKSYLQMRRANCPLYGAPNPNMIPCWESKMVSNTLQLPR